MQFEEKKENIYFPKKFQCKNTQTFIQHPGTHAKNYLNLSCKPGCLSAIFHRMFTGSTSGLNIKSAC
jgi:hypothetical protein